MSILFGYYDLGLRALNAARLGLQVAGDNISNISTPGYAKRRLDLRSGFPTPVEGGMLDRGVEIDGIRRVADRFLQLSLERERGSAAGSKETLRGLDTLESLFGSLDSEGLHTLYADFSDRFAELSGESENATARRIAISSADTLARRIRDTHSRLQAQARSENESIQGLVGEINTLAAQLARLNREIVSAESGGSEASPLRDERERLVEQLADLTGGSTAPGGGGRLVFAIPDGPTLVSGDNAIPLTVSADPQGFFQIASGPIDYTSRLRQGQLGALLGLRDDQIGSRLADLDTLAADLITRANAATAGGLDLDGNAGGPLFLPDPAPASGAAAQIAVDPALLADSRRLAISATGAPGDGSIALQISEVRETAAAALGNRSPAAFLADVIAGIGTDAVQAEVAFNVSNGLVENFEAQRDAVSGVSLDEEAVSLVQHQQAYEAAARFMQVLNQITEVTLSLGR